VGSRRDEKRSDVRDSERVEKDTKRYKQVIMKYTIRVNKGGEGSGFHGHAGRPGLVGGSSEEGRSRKTAGRKAYTGLVPKEMESMIKKSVADFENYVKPTRWERENLEVDLEYASEELLDGAMMEIGWAPDNMQEQEKLDEFIRSKLFLDYARRQALCNMLVNMTDKERKALRRE